MHAASAAARRASLAGMVVGVGTPAGAPVVGDAAWAVLLSAHGLARSLEQAGTGGLFGVNGAGSLEPVGAGAPDAVLEWRPGHGWCSRLPSDDPRGALVDLYLPICGATPARPIAVGHLGQSLDGFIATHEGDSRFVTGEDNIVHLHRMRALCDAVVVGAGTVAADDPRLTVRHVRGASPLRVIFDPRRRLSPAFRLFGDDSVPTLYACAGAHVRPGERAVGSASIVPLQSEQPESGLVELLEILRARGCARLFVEGGGVTVSTALEADALDRLHIAIAPVLIGDGRPAIRLAPHARLRDCRRPAYRVFRMGGDVLFDCDLRSSFAGADEAPVVTRVI